MTQIGPTTLQRCAGLLRASLGGDRTLGIVLVVSIVMTLWGASVASGSVLLGIASAAGIATLLCAMNAMVDVANRVSLISRGALRTLALAGLTIGIVGTAVAASAPVVWLLLRASMPGDAIWVSLADPALVTAVSVLVLLVVALASPLMVTVMGAAAYRRTRRLAVVRRDLRLLTSLTWVFHCGIGLAASGAIG